jgi:hypothetical protein
MKNGAIIRVPLQYYQFIGIKNNGITAKIYFV